MYESTTNVDLKCKIMPVTNGSTGIVTKVLKKNLEPILRKHSGDSLQKAAILVTSHIIQKVLQFGTRSLSCGVYSWFKRRSIKEKRPVVRDVMMMMMMMMMMMIIMIIIIKFVQ